MGSTAYEQKRDLRRSQRKTVNGRLVHPDAVHGKFSSYSNYLCRCEECSAAWAAYCKKRRKERMAVEIPEGVAHGKPTTYSNYRCRCDQCLAAWRNSHKARRVQQ